MPIVRPMARDIRRSMAWLLATCTVTSVVSCSEDRAAESVAPDVAISTPAAPPATTDTPTSTVLDLDGDFEATVTANGKDLLVSCSGQGPVTVVLIAGYGESSSTFLDLVDQLAADTRVCAYDRPGTGVSEPPDEDQTFRTEAADLSALLDEVRAPAPYVVVAHSLGGGVGVELAAARPEEVEGLLLLDATPTGWLEATHAVPENSPGGEELAAGYRLFVRPDLNKERFDGLTAFRQLAQIRSLGSLPLVVDNAVDARRGLGLSDRYTDAVSAAWNAGQRRFAQLSSQGTYRVVPGGHYVHQDQTALVLRQVRDLVESAAQPQRRS